MDIQSSAVVAASPSRPSSSWIPKPSRTPSPSAVNTLAVKLRPFDRMILSTTSMAANTAKIPTTGTSTSIDIGNALPRLSDEKSRV